jgi:hypothetical protein
MNSAGGPMWRRPSSAARYDACCDVKVFLTPAIASEIDLLFNAKPGPELRHELAHGQISAGGCFSQDVYYANWLIYRLCCLLVIQSWDELVIPTPSDQNPCAQSRRPIDMMVQGCSTSLFQAWQQ